MHASKCTYDQNLKDVSSKTEKRSHSKSFDVKVGICMQIVISGKMYML